MRLLTTLVLAALAVAVLPAHAGKIWDQWRVRPSSLAEAGLNTRAYSDPDVVASPEMALACDLWETRPQEHNLMLVFTFKDESYTTFVRDKKDRVQLQLGFWSGVEGEDGNYRLRQELVDYGKGKRSWAYKPYRIAGRMRHPPEERGLSRLFHHEAADIARRTYNSESFSWGNRRTGEVYSVEIGDKGRNAIKQVLEVCGFSVHESSATPTAAADLSSRHP